MSDLKASLLKIAKSHPELKDSIQEVLNSLPRDKSANLKRVYDQLEEIPSAIKDVAGEIFQAYSALMDAEEQKGYDDALRQLENSARSLEAELRLLRKLIKAA